MKKYSKILAWARLIIAITGIVVIALNENRDFGSGVAFGIFLLSGPEAAFELFNKKSKAGKVIN